MTGLFADFDLATGGYAGDEPWLLSLGLDAQQAMEPLERLRAEWAEPVARGNALITLPITIAPPPGASVDESFLTLLSYYQALPREGALILTSGAHAVTFESAVLVSCRGRRRGVSCQFDLVFVCGEPDTEPTLLQTMSAKYPNILTTITGLTGGTSDKLDSVATVGVAVGRWVIFNNTTAGVPQDWELIAGTNAEDAAGGIVRPDDYHATDNAKVWVQRR